MIEKELEDLKKDLENTPVHSWFFESHSNFLSNLHASFKA